MTENGISQKWRHVEEVEKENGRKVRKLNRIWDKERRWKVSVKKENRTGNVD